MPQERLQKILAHAGIASRRQAEQMMLEGRVRVNGAVVTELGAKADVGQDHIRVDGKLIRPQHHQVYLAFNKPKNCMTTTSDPEGRETVMDLLKGVKERVYPVGRLDYQSEGLLLFTNDGEFANRITSAANHIAKIYAVKVKGTLTEDQEAKFRAGVPLKGKKTAPAGLKIVKRAANPWYEVRLIEGRQNQIRLMFNHFGLLVEKLKRVKIAFLDLGPLKPGEHRHLAPPEVARFKKLLKMDKEPSDGHHSRASS
jgi:23S rRNA pseudouridine2605 synthase